MTAYFDGKAKFMQAGWYNNSASFQYAHDFSGSWSGHLYEPFGLRGVGWHTFAWEVSGSGGIDLVIDGNLIVDGLVGPGGVPVSTLSAIRLSAGSDPSTYSFLADDYAVAIPAAPPPTMTTS